MARNRRSLLRPESRAALDALKQDVLREKAASSAPSGPRTLPTENKSSAPSVQGVAKAVGIPYREGKDNGQITARQAGKIGGEIGGSMVQRLVALAEQQLQSTDKSPGPKRPLRP